MKICFLITGLGVGGAERHLLKLVPKLRFEKLVISLSNVDLFGKELEKKGIKVYYLGIRKYNFLSVMFRFRKLLKQEKPEILDTYLPHSNLFGRLFGRISGIKWIISSVRSDYSRFRLLSFLDRITKKKVDLYILNSEALLSYVNGKNKVPLEKIKILPNGVDLNQIYEDLDKKYNIREELGLDKDTFIITSIVRLQKDKNISILIKSIKELHNKIVLIIVGEGPERKNLEDLVKQLDLEKRVYFLSERLDVFNILNSSDVFILSSIREGMSNALLEAMALKKICIVSKIPQNEILIKDRINGFLFNPKDEKDLAEKIVFAYNNNLNAIAEEAFNTIKKNYDINKIINKYENIVQDLLKS